MTDRASGAAPCGVYNARVSAVRRIHEDLAIFRIRMDAGTFTHEAGQFAVLGLGVWEPTLADVPDRVAAPPPPDHVVRRAYSVSSSIVDSHGALLSGDEADVEFYVTLVRDDDPVKPSLTSRLFRLGAGSRIWMSERASGRYTLDGVEPDDSVLFLATGTGEAPHNRMILELLNRGHRGSIASVVSVRRDRDLGYRGVHEELARGYPRYRYVALTTREPGRPKVHIQDLLRSPDLGARIGFTLDAASAHVFVCGNPAMIGIDDPGGVAPMLMSRGFTTSTGRDPGRLHVEKYWTPSSEGSRSTGAGSK